jgi:outer membrane biosynthesis protein TonB
MVSVGKAASRAVVVAVLILPMAAALQNSATDQRYPKEALRKRHEVTLTFTVDVTADGKAESCPVIGSIGWPELDKATCLNA